MIVLDYLVRRLFHPCIITTQKGYTSELYKLLKLKNILSSFFVDAMTLISWAQHP